MNPERTGRFNFPETAPKKSFSGNLRPSLVARIVDRLRTIHLFYLVSALFQIITGFLVTAAAMLNLISPMWLSALLSLLGCVVAMLGVYQFYDILKSTKSTRALARDAIERAIRSRN